MISLALAALALNPSGAAAADLIPGETVATAPAEREIRFASADGRATLSGTLTLPRGPGPFPAAVLLSVAGPDDRDQTLGPHRGYRDLAHRLAAEGIASLRFDDRGVGGSTGDYLSLSWAGFAEDAATAFDQLATTSSVDGSRIGFIGMSQGGAIGALATRLRPASAFLVLLSAPGVDGRTALRAQLDATLRLSGVTGPLAEQYRVLFDQFTGIVLDRAAGRDLQRQRMLAFLAGPGRALIPPYAFIPRDNAALADMLLGDWYFSNVTFDPTPVYADLAVPVLAVGGRLDPVAPPALHLTAIETLLGDGPGRERRIVTLARGNHLLQNGTSGLPAEYRTIDHAISREALDTVANWLSGQVGRAAR